MGGTSPASLPRYHQRAYAHNYYAPFIYHIILKKQEAFEVFGEVRGDARIPPGQPGCAYIEETRIGSIIAKETVRIQSVFPILQIYQYQVMPDHAHILIRVKEWSKYHLDYYIETLRDNIANRYSNTIGRKVSADEIFLPGYCDKPLLLGRSLDALFRYIRENPHRLAMRQQFPQFFQRTRKLEIAGTSYEAYGNLFLFRNPDKAAVRISRRFTTKEKAQKETTWLESASKGTILVSPFISKDEKGIRTKAEELGAKVILIVHQAFPERYKPAAHDFDLCAAGRLLIISLGKPEKTELSRSLCLQMNELAEKIAALC